MMENFKTLLRLTLSVTLLTVCFTICGIVTAQTSGSTQADFDENGDGQYSTEEIKKLRDKADNGDAGAQCMVGKCYDKGNGVEQDYEEAVRWY